MERASLALSNPRASLAHPVHLNEVGSSYRYHSVRRFLFMQGRSFCIFDEISADTSANRILKATLKILLSAQDMDSGLRKRVHSTYRSLQGIQDIKLSRNAFRSVRVTSNSLFYRFLLDVCNLVFESLLVDEASGSARFKDFTRDDDKMARLFQSFLFNFIARECPQWAVRSENIRWLATSETELAPQIRTVA
ncbi:5-methylcytosine restriction system specificity protein McrC [Bradyrhizobium liaoningense]